MRTQSQTPSSTDSAELTIVDLEAREAPHAESVKGGCEWYIGGRTAHRCPTRKPRSGYWG
jgi:hypothetical protein